MQKLINWFTICCSQKPTQTQAETTQSHKTTIAPNIQVTIRFLQKGIYNNRVTNVNQMKIMFVKHVSKEQQFSEPSKIMSAMRKSNSGIRDYKVRLVEGDEKIFADFKNYQHFQQMSDILEDVKKSVVMSDRFEISLFFDAEVEDFRKQILEDVLKQFRALGSVKGKKFEIYLTENSQEGMKEIMGICESVRNNSLEDTNQFFKKYSTHQTVAHSQVSLTNN